MNIGDSATLTGAIERIIFQSADGGFTVASFKPDAELYPFNVVGSMTDVQLGEPVEVQGTWVRHPRFGEQLKVHALRYVLPASREGIEAYLSSGLIEGVGPVLAQRIVSRFGATTPAIIDRDPDRLLEVDGIGPKRAGRIAQSWRERREINDVMMFLRGLGIGPQTALNIYRIYGKATEAAVRSNPYQLIYDVRGIGFLKADGIALRLGLDRTGEERLQAGVYHVLQEYLSDGHVYVPQDDLVHQAVKLLEVDKALVQEAISRLRKTRRIHVEESLQVGGRTTGRGHSATRRLPQPTARPRGGSCSLPERVSQGDQWFGDPRSRRRLAGLPGDATGSEHRSHRGAGAGRDLGADLQGHRAHRRARHR